MPPDEVDSAPPRPQALIHGTTIALGDFGAMIVGPPGSGKSDLALRCLALSNAPLIAEPVTLVSDDQTLVYLADGQLVAAAPPAIYGMIEVRGVGILPVAARPTATLVLIADLVGEPIERLPPESQDIDILGLSVPRMRLEPFENSAPLKLLLSLQQVAQNGRVSP